MNFHEIAARRKLGKPDGWKVVKWEVVGNTRDVLVSGGVPDGVYKSGARKGRPKWVPPFDVCVVTSAEEYAERRRYESDTGSCANCEGTGQEWAGWNHITGNKTRSCRRCASSGRAAVDATAAAAATGEPT